MNPGEVQRQPNWRVLTIITWTMLVLAPAVYLVIAWLLDSKGLEAKAGNEMLVYLLLVVAIVEPAFMPIVTRLEVRKFRKGVSQAKSPAQLFLSLSIIHMAVVEAVYIFALICFILTAKFTYMLWFYPIGIAWSYVYWPRREKFNRLLEKLDRHEP